MAQVTKYASISNQRSPYFFLIKLLYVLTFKETIERFNNFCLGGPYSVFAGRDASRALATFEVHSVSEEYDDLSDLKQSELNEVKEWDLQFSEKYTLVGKLLKPGEQPTSYSDDEGTDDEAAIAEENRKLKRLSSGQKLTAEDQD